MNAAARHEDLLRLLDAALTAHQGGSEHEFRATVDALVEWRSRPLQAVLARLAQELADSLSGIPVPAHADPSLVHDLPDARSRLDHVVAMTADAAHRTLDCVETCRTRLAAMEQFALPTGCIGILDGMRTDLSTMALAQAYQDLTGQIIRRVIGVVHRVEAALDELGMRAPTAAPSADALAGPAVPQLDAAAFSQDDADALLCGLGL